MMAMVRLVCAVAALLLPCAVSAQAQKSARVFRVGLVNPLRNSLTTDAFRQGLKEAGYVEGKSVVVESRFTEGHAERFPALIAELIGRKIDVLVVGSTPGALAAKSATRTVPIVFAGVIDPLGPGIVTSLARPAGNITGVTFGVAGAGFAGKWLELLREADPAVRHVAVLVNRGNPIGSTLLAETQTAATEVGVQVDAHDVRNADDLEMALVAIGKSGAKGLIVTSDSLFTDNRSKLVRFAASKRLPAVYFTKLFAQAGGLMSYGASLEDSYRKAATYVGRILHGAKPGDLPIEQPTRFELVVNLKAARVLGLVIPRSLLLRADQVIQ